MERYCTKCGKLTSKKNDSLFVCEAGHENWVNPPVGAVVFVIKDGKVLYGVRGREPGKGKLDPPGGIIEIGETAEQTTVRETKEEMGLDIALIDILGTYATTYDGRPILDIVYIANPTSDDTTPGDDMDGGEPVWRSIEDLPSSDEQAFDWLTVAHEDLLAWWRQNEVR